MKKAFIYVFFERGLLFIELLCTSVILTHFMLLVFFYTPWKKSEKKLCFSGVFRGYKPDFLILIMPDFCDHSSKIMFLILFFTLFVFKFIFHQKAFWKTVFLKSLLALTKHRQKLKHRGFLKSSYLEHFWFTQNFPE